MKIAILSANPKLYSTRRLKEACLRREHTARVLNPLAFSIVVEQGTPALYYKDKPLAPVDAVIPRIGTSITFFGTAVVRQFEQMGVFCVNSSQAITIARDKLRSMQVFSRHAVGMPKTVFVRQKTSILPAIEMAGGAPVIIKLLEGTQGIGVILAETNKVAESIIETLQTTKQNVLIQHFIRESQGRDLRALVIGGRVVAAMRRTAKLGEFRSNVHRGGSVQGLDLSPEFEATALRAAQIMGLGVAGVDILESDDGPKVMEVNSSPGLEGIEQATGVDVADAIIEHIEAQVLFPEVDLRQRLTLQEGYGVLEVPLPRTSALCGKTLQETGLRDELDVLVLSILRGSEAIPNPRGSTRILPGDVLLCFGRLATLGTLVPEKKKRRKRRATLAGDGPDHPPAEAGPRSDEPHP